jgi:hypothetical protein
MLSGACFCYNALFPHPTGKQYLTYSVVYLVGTGMAQIF